MTTTWVPVPDRATCARVLDNKRLGAQRGEGLIVLHSLADPAISHGWARAPVTSMWRGSERFYAGYGIAVCREWRRRGFSDSCLEQYVTAWGDFPPESDVAPWWWGDHSIHECHRRELLRRLPEWYTDIWPEERPHEERRLVWPTAA